MIPTFTDPSLLEEALTHTSWAYENGGTHNERLEFPGRRCSPTLQYGAPISALSR